MPAGRSLPDSQFFKLVATGEGIWAATATDFIAAVGNAGIVDLGGRWLVVDTFISARAAADLRAAVRTLAGDEPLWVVNTHSHVDHVSGNEVFSDAAAIAATAATRDRLLEMAARLPDRIVAAEAAAASAPVGDDADSERRRRELNTRLQVMRQLHVVAPNATITDRLTLYGDRRRADLIALGTAHTTGDLAIHLPDDGTLLAGDVVVKRTMPALQDGNAIQWLVVLERLRLLGATTLLPGHGPVGDAATLDEMEDCLRALVAAAGDLAMEPGEPRSSIPERFEAWGGAARWSEAVGLVASRLQPSGAAR